MGLRPHIIPGAQRTAIGITGNQGTLDRAEFEDLPGVAEAIPVSKAYKLVSREVKPEDTVVRVAGVAIGGRDLVIIAGPCSVESREQILGRRARREGGRSHRAARRRLQAAHFALRLPGARARKG